MVGTLAADLSRRLGSGQWSAAHEGHDQRHAGEAL
jgi:hypothetical protein